MVERELNENFDLKGRNLIQGLPISPILCNIAVKNCLDDLKKEFNLGKEFKFLTYADDLCFFLNKQEFEKIGGYKFKEKLNLSLSLRKHGFQVDITKSEIVKEKEIWKKKI